MLEQLISFFETTPLDEVTKLLKEYDIEFRKDKVIEEDKSMKKIKIKKWKELQGLNSEDKWGNETQIFGASYGYVDVATRSKDSALYVRRIRTDLYNIIKGGRERVLEELKICGFDVEFIEKPKLTEDQRLELTYQYRFDNKKWIARDRNGLIYMFKSKPDKKSKGWNVFDGIFFSAKLSYDFILWEDDEPWSIEELLEGDK